MRTAARFLAVAALFLVAAACSAQRAGGDRHAEGATLFVNNQTFLDQRMYVIGAGPRIRLGTVTASSTARLRIPGHVIGLGREVRFLADPIGSQTVAQSFNMFVRPGQEVTITVPPSVR